MYATRFADQPRFRPASMAAAVALNGAVIAALVFAAPDILPDLPRPPIITFVPAPDPPPPPPEPQPTSQVKRPVPQPTAAPGPAPIPDTPTRTIDTGIDAGPATAGGEPGIGSGSVAEPARPAPPPLVGATFDPRYAADVEPPYPDFARDAGIEGTVRLRLLIGADGRVKRADPLSGDRALARLAVRHVLARWRFRPATRGGVPEESSQVMLLRFRLDG